MKNQMLLKVFVLVIAVSAISGCQWYWDTSKKIGSHMPTYDDWFGDGEKDKRPSELPPPPPPQR